jgi:hypothetical protein
MHEESVQYLIREETLDKVISFLDIDYLRHKRSYDKLQLSILNRFNNDTNIIRYNIENHINDE